MKKDFALSIPKPCHQDWNKFTPTTQGRFCGSCSKEVIDFTQWDTEKIKGYFSKPPRPTCGRFNVRQLKTYSSPPASQRSWLPAPFVALLLLLASRPSEAQQQREEPAQEQLDIRKQYSQSSDTVVRKLIVTGTVMDGSDKSNIPGVNVILKGTSQGTVTDGEGKFMITIKDPKPSETLVFSFIGYVMVEREVSTATKNSVSVSMDADVQKLGETIVVGGTVSVSRFSPRRVWWWVKRGCRRY
jgi:CarboxypepD_reg-like domain